MLNRSEPRPEWTTFRAGQIMACPARRHYTDASGRDHDTCDRHLGEVGPGLGVRIRVHPGGKRGRPAEGTTTRCCPRCSTMLEFAEERRSAERAPESPMRPAA